MPAFLTDRKWLTVLLAVFMAVALSACGGGGGGTTQVPEPPVPPPTAEEMCTDAGNHWVDGACLTPGENTVRMTLASIAMAATAADAQAAYDAVKDQVTATQGEQLQMAVDARVEELATMARADNQKQALMDAADMIDTSDLSTQALVDAARTAIAGLRQAIADAEDVDDTSMYQTMLDNAVDAVDMAQGGIDTAARRTNQMAALTSASTMLQVALAALSGSTPTQEQLDAANNALTALNNAITGGADLTNDEKAPYQREANNAAAPIRTAQMAFDDAEDEADKAANAAMAAAGKALKSALTTTPLASLGVSNLDGDGATPDTRALLAGSNLTVGTSNRAATSPTITASPSMKAGDSAGALGSWAGTHYAHTHAVTKVSNSAVVYTNQAPPKMQDFEDGVDATADGTYVAADRELTLSTAGLETNKKIKGSDFATIGTKTHEPKGGLVTVTGSYDGVSGTYYCNPDGTTSCTSTYTTSGLTLAGPTTDGWRFEHPKGAMVPDPDTDYLYFGWWLSKDKDGKPTRASAFTGVAGTAPAALTGLNTIVGTAIYAGKAAGKFAIYNPLDSTGDAGHFTADATLTAKFSGTGAGVTGTINNFMANEKSVPWSVSLNNNNLMANDGSAIADPAVTTKPTGCCAVGNNMSDAGAITSVSANYGWTAGDDRDTTVWSIDGNAAPASGTWNAQMYDEAQTGSADDGSNVPTTVTGMFESSFGSIGQMVGAFGAEN